MYVNSEAKAGEFQVGSQPGQLSDTLSQKGGWGWDVSACLKKLLGMGGIIHFLAVIVVLCFRARGRDFPFRGIYQSS